MQNAGSDLIRGQNVKLGKNIRFGRGVTLHDNVEIGDEAIVGDYVTLGEPLAQSFHDQSYENPPLRIGPRSLIRSHSVLYAGSTIGSHFQTGHRVTIREFMRIGDSVAIGTGSDLLGRSSVGNYCRLHSDVFVAQNVHIGDFALVYPRVLFTDDPTPPSYVSRGARVCPFAQIGASTTLLPDVVVGLQSVIGAGSLVTRSIEDGVLAIGRPARPVKSIADVSNENGGPAYPWPQRFSRGMPWDGLDFTTWCREKHSQEVKEWMSRLSEKFLSELQ